MLCVDMLSTELVPLVEKLPRLEALHFDECNGGGRDKKRDPGPVFTAPPGPARKGKATSGTAGGTGNATGAVASSTNTLAEVDVFRRAPAETMISLMIAHRASLRRLRLPFSITGKKLK